MIRYALICSDCDAEFDAWFAGSAAYDEQSAAGLIECLGCGGNEVAKAIMAPAINRPQTDKSVDPVALVKQVARKAREHISENFDYVGDKFADEARSMHYGEKDHRPIWGQTTKEESDALEAEGVPAESLPEPLVPDIPKPKDKLN